MITTSRTKGEANKDIRAKESHVHARSFDIVLFIALILLNSLFGCTESKRKTVFLGGGESSFSQQKEKCLDWISNDSFLEFARVLFEETRVEHAIYCVDYPHIHDPRFLENVPIYRPAIFNSDLVDASELPNVRIVDAFYKLESSIGKDCLSRYFNLIDVYKGENDSDRIVFRFEPCTYLVRGNPYNALYNYDVPFSYNSERIDDPTTTWEILYARLMLEPEIWYLVEFNYETEFDELLKQMQEWYAIENR